MTNTSSVLPDARPRSRHRRRAGLVAGLALSGLLLAACGGDDPEAGPADETTAADDATDEAAEQEPATDAGGTEVSARAPRLAITHDDGIQVLDAATLEVLGDVDLPGFNRLNPAGDERHLFVSTTGGFRLLDAGAWGEPHGDHSHYYTAEPALTDVLVEAETPGHVVVHGGRTALFDDGTGQVSVFDSAEAADVDRETREHTTPTAHHGVAVELDDGSLVVSEGDENARTGIRVLDASGTEIAASDECPDVHGETVAADEAVVIGCEDGALIYAGGQVTKAQSPDAYGRIGNQAGSDVSPIVLGDYKSDPDAELERPTRVALIDTRTATITLVDLPASYTFRSLARGDDGEALVLGTDGQIHVIDPESAQIVTSIPVIEPWEEPIEWQEPRPSLTMLDGSAYVTDPATNSIHAVDIPTSEVWASADLDVTPNELSGVTGDAPPAGHGDGEHDHADGEHGHEGEHDHGDDGHGDDGHDHEDDSDH